MSVPTYESYLFAARKVMGALEELGETSCLVGGMAVRLNGKKDRVVRVSTPTQTAIMDKYSPMEQYCRLG
jgi:hypothetical protein